MVNNVQVYVKCHLVVFTTIHKVIPISESMNQPLVYLCDNLGEASEWCQAIFYNRF